jgi:hypothetical protein
MPSRPRASPRSRASACDPGGARRQASTSTAAPTGEAATDKSAVGEHIVIVVIPLADGRLVAARLRIRWVTVPGPRPDLPVSLELSLVRQEAQEAVYALLA